MIKATLENQAEEKTEISYPCLMKGSLTGCLVLMVSPARGVLVEGELTGVKQGEYWDDWTMPNFKPLPKGQKVTLENV